MSSRRPFQFRAARPSVGVAGLVDDARFAAALDAVAAQLEGRCDVSRFDLREPARLADADCELVIVVGGDGSILRAAGAMADRQKPTLGVNAGKLGFLADVQPEEVGRLVDQLFAGDCLVVDHVMLDCQADLAAGGPLATLALNEVTVRAGAPYRMIDVDLFVDGEQVTTYSCDGVILGTPIGSTAHSLSAGGPILRKSLGALVVTPLSPHALTNRPVVDSADRVFEFAMAGGEGSAAIVIDGAVRGELTGERRLTIRRAKSVFQLIEAPDHSYYRTLREKLHWGGGLRRSLQAKARRKPRRDRD